MDTPTVYETRRANLARLLEPRGARTQLALRLGVTQSHVSHLLRPPAQKFARAIHEDMARQIETAMGLDPGQLDWPGGRRPAPVAVLDERLLAASMQAVLAALPPGPNTTERATKAATLVDLVYREARLTGQVDPAHVAQLVRLAG